MSRPHASLALASVFVWAAAHLIGAAEPAPLPMGTGCPTVTKVRFFPRAGKAQLMKGGKFSGSNEGATAGFQTLAEIKEAPADGQRAEIEVKRPERYRFVKYEAPLASHGAVAEIEFYDGETKLSGVPFGTQGSRNNSGMDFTKALDGDPATFFDGAEPHNQYVGLDFGPASQAAQPTFSPAPGVLPAAQTVAISCATPGASIRYSMSGGTPTRQSGALYKGPVKIEKGLVLTAIAYTDRLAASPIAVGPYRIGEVPKDSPLVRSFHIGNSLTDTVNDWLQALADSGGKKFEYHRFTIPGAPTDWLWQHPGTGFGDSHFQEAFFSLAPIDHIVTQPFAGHGRSISNEAEFSGKFFEACRKHSSAVQPWLYVQWPGPKFDDRWSKGEGDDLKPLSLKRATTWQEGVAHHLAYTERLRDTMMETWKGQPILIVPGGAALATLKTEMDAGRVPGMTDFFKEIFADGIHLTAKGRYLISLVHYACFFKEDPTGKVSELKSGLTPEQAALFQKIAWDTVRNYKWAGVTAK